MFISVWEITDQTYNQVPDALIRICLSTFARNVSPNSTNQSNEPAPEHAYTLDIRSIPFKLRSAVAITCVQCAWQEHVKRYFPTPHDNSQLMANHGACARQIRHCGWVASKPLKMFVRKRTYANAHTNANKKRADNGYERGLFGSEVWSWHYEVLIMYLILRWLRLLNGSHLKTAAVSGVNESSADSLRALSTHTHTHTQYIRHTHSFTILRTASIQEVERTHAHTHILEQFDPHILYTQSANVSTFFLVSVCVCGVVGCWLVGWFNK